MKETKVTPRTKQDQYKGTCGDICWAALGVADIEIEVATSYNKDSESTGQWSVVEIILHDGNQAVSNDIRISFWAENLEKILKIFFKKRRKKGTNTPMEKNGGGKERRKKKEIVGSLTVSSFPEEKMK